MTDESAFFAAIKAAPDDDAPRLTYADWLDENGRSDRAAYIRRQVADPDRVDHLALPDGAVHTVRRGFVESAAVRVAHLSALDSLLAENPVREVVLADLPLIDREFVFRTPMWNGGEPHVVDLRCELGKYQTLVTEVISDGDIGGALDKIAFLYGVRDRMLARASDEALLSDWLGGVRVRLPAEADAERATRIAGTVRGDGFALLRDPPLRLARPRLSPFVFRHVRTK